jgi:hypothetical protein
MIKDPYTKRVWFWLGLLVGLIPSFVLMAVAAYVLRQHG